MLVQEGVIEPSETKKSMIMGGVLIGICVLTVLFLRMNSEVLSDMSK